MTASIRVLFPAAAEIAALPAFARSAEAWGFDELWVVEDCFASGGLTMAATALAVTERLRVGVGLLPAVVRNPAIVAMEIAALARLHPDRFSATFGHGVRGWMAQIGAVPPDRLAALREVVAAVRALLAGERVTVHGRSVQLADVSLDNPPDRVPPVLIGTTGERGLALAAQVADGLLLPEGCGPAFIGQARDRVAAARRGSFRTAVYAWLAIDDDDRRARSALAPAVAHWLDSGLYPGPVAAAGMSAGTAPGELTAEQAGELALAGDAHACAAAVRRWAQAGADAVILTAPGPGWQSQYERFGSEVLPLLEGARRSDDRPPRPPRPPRSPGATGRESGV